MYRFLTLIILTFSQAVLSFAHSGINCFSISELVHLQSSSLNIINSQLKSKQWEIESKVKNEIKSYLNYELGYSANQWRIKSSKYFEGIFSLYIKKDQPNIIILQTTEDCFNNLIDGSYNKSQLNQYEVWVKKIGINKIELRKYKNPSENRRFSVLVYNADAFDNLIRIQNYQIAIREGDIAYRQGKFLDATNLYNQALQLLENYESNTIEDVNKKLAECNRKIEIENIIKTGDNLFSSGNYQDAMNYYESALIISLPEETLVRDRLDERINKCKNQLSQIELNKKISSLIIEGDDLYKKNDYSNALMKFNAAKNLLSLLNPKNYNLEREIIKKIEICARAIQLSSILKIYYDAVEILNKAQNLSTNNKFNEARLIFENAKLKFQEAENIYNNNSSVNDPPLLLKIKTGIENCRSNIQKMQDKQNTFSYASLNPYDYIKFKNSTVSLLNSMVSSIKGSGNLYFNTTINFDHMGNNKSSLKIFDYSNKKISLTLSAGIDFSKLPASKKSDYFVGSEEVTAYNLLWNTKRYTASSKRSKIEFFPQSPPNSDNLYIESFIKKQILTRGIYHFNIIDKQLNNKKFTDIELMRYRNCAGPSKMLYSAIWPGWGRYLVTDGKKGKGKAWFFLFTGGVTVASKLFSDDQFVKYKNSIDQRRMDVFYKNADIANKVFLISGGITALTYFHEIFWVFGKGIKNNKLTKGLKVKLKNGPLIINEAPMKP